MLTPKIPSAQWSSGTGSGPKKLSSRNKGVNGGRESVPEDISGHEEEALRYGDCVTLFAENLFGFLQRIERDGGTGLAVNIIDGKNRAGSSEAETFQLITRHDYDCQCELQDFLISNSLQHPSDVEKLDPHLRNQLEQLQILAEEEVQQNEERQLLCNGTPVNIHQDFQLMHLHSHLFVSALGPMSTGVSGSSAIALPVFDSQPIFLFGPLLSVSAVHGEGRRVDSPLRHRSRADKSGGTTQARVALLEGGKGSLLRFVRASSPPSDALAPAEGRIVREQAPVAIAFTTVPHCFLGAAASPPASWDVVGVGQGTVWSVGVTSQARPAALPKGEGGDSVTGAVESAKLELRALLGKAQRRRDGMGSMLEHMDSRLAQVNKGFDQMVLQMMLHFQELHQALEQRENQLLSEARAKMMEKVSTLSECRNDVAEAFGQANEAIGFAERLTNMDGHLELLQLLPKASRRLTQVGNAEVHRDVDAKISFRYAFNQHTLESIRGHGSVELSLEHTSSPRARPAHGHSLSSVRASHPPPQPTSTFVAGTQPPLNTVGQKALHPSLSGWLAQLREPLCPAPHSDSEGPPAASVPRPSGWSASRGPAAWMEKRGPRSHRATAPGPVSVTHWQEGEGGAGRGRADGNCGFRSKGGRVGAASEAAGGRGQRGSGEKALPGGRIHERMTMSAKAKMTPRRQTPVVQDVALDVEELW